MTLTTTSSSTELEHVTNEFDPAAPAKRRYFSADRKKANLDTARRNQFSRHGG